MMTHLDLTGEQNGKQPNTLDVPNQSIPLQYLRIFKHFVIIYVILCAVYLYGF